jgi:hypothetical protein
MPEIFGISLLVAISLPAFLLELAINLIGKNNKLPKGYN